MYTTGKKFSQLWALSLAGLYLVELDFMFSLVPKGYSVNIYNQIGHKIILINMLIYGMYLIFLDLDKERDILTMSLASLILLLNYTTLMMAPNLLGYYVTDRGDTLDSVGLVRHITKTGHIDSLDIYPMAFIESAILGEASDIQAPWIFVSFLASLLFVFGTVTFTHIFIKNTISTDTSRHLIPVLLSISVPYYLGMYHTSFIAQYIAFAMESIFLLSFFLYLFKGSRRLLIPLLLSTIFSIFGHPVIGVFNMYLMLLYFTFFTTKNSKIFDLIKGTLKITLIILILWFIEVGLLKQYIYTLEIILKTDFRIYSSVIELSKKTGITATEIMKYAFIRYGDQIMLYLMSIMSIVLIIRKRLYNDIKVLIMLAGFILSNMFSIFIIIFPLLKQNYNRVLGLNLGLYFTIPLVGLLMLRTFKRHTIKKYMNSMLFIIYVISVIGLFLSPYTGFPFIGITNSELSGVVFMFSHQNEEYKVVDLIGDSKRYSIWYYGYSETFKQRRVLYLYRLPDHFNYPQIYPIKENTYLIKIQHNILSQSEVPYSYSHLIIPIAKYMIEPYETVETYRRVHRWSYHDLRMIYCDPTADIIYQGNDFIIIVIP